MFMASPRSGGPCSVQTAAGLFGSDEVTDPADATVVMTFSSVGTYQFTNGSTGNWIEPRSCPGGLYEIQLVISGASPDTGPSPIGAGNWYDLGNTRSWSWTQDGVADKIVTFTATIREIANPSNSGTFSGTVSAIVNAPE